MATCCAHPSTLLGICASDYLSGWKKHQDTWLIDLMCFVTFQVPHESLCFSCLDLLYARPSTREVAEQLPPPNFSKISCSFVRHKNQSCNRFASPLLENSTTKSCNHTPSPRKYQLVAALLQGAKNVSQSCDLAWTGYGNALLLSVQYTSTYQYVAAASVANPIPSDIAASDYTTQWYYTERFKNGSLTGCTTLKERSPYNAMIDSHSDRPSSAKVWQFRPKYFLR